MSIDQTIQALADWHKVEPHVIEEIVRAHPSAYQHDAEILPFRPQLRVVE